jgi:hypothetical protein
MQEPEAKRLVAECGGSEFAVVVWCQAKAMTGWCLLLFIAVDTGDAGQPSACELVDGAGKGGDGEFAMPTESALAPKS